MGYENMSSVFEESKTSRITAISRNLTNLKRLQTSVMCFHIFYIDVLHQFVVS